MLTFLDYFVIFTAIPYAVSAYLLIHAIRHYFSPLSTIKITQTLEITELLVTLDSGIFVGGYILYFQQLLENSFTLGGKIPKLYYIPVIFVLCWVPLFILAVYLKSRMERQVDEDPDLSELLNQTIK